MTQITTMVNLRHPRVQSQVGLVSMTMTKPIEVMEFQLSYFKSIKMML